MAKKPALEDTSTILVNNHLELIVQTHEIEDNKYRIVGFEVEPLSIKWGQVEPSTVDPYRTELPPQEYKEGENISYTYRVRFEESATTWSHRNDHYLKLGNDRIHHAQMIVGCLIALVMTYLARMVLNRTLN